MVIEVGYWKLRGLVGGIKVLLEYCGAEWKWVEFDHHLQNDGSYDRAEWLKVRVCTCSHNSKKVRIFVEKKFSDSFDFRHT